jgi:AraC-like DNA-binding protein
MIHNLPTEEHFVILKHDFNLYSFYFHVDKFIYILGPEIIETSSTNELHQKNAYLSENLNTTILNKSNCIYQLVLFSHLIGLPINDQQINNAFENASYMPHFQSAVSYIDLNDEGAHINHSYEIALKSAVLLGNDTQIHDIFTKLMTSGRIGILSQEGSIRSIKNWGIIIISVILRSVIDAGMDYDMAYTLNDEYVRNLEILPSFNKVISEIEISLKDMSNRVLNLKNENLSKNVRLVYQHIINSPETTVSVSELSYHLNISPHYLSTIFKKEIGITIPQFKILIKVNRAMQLIMTTNLSLATIANTLNFSDQAHLTREFKKRVRVAPSKLKKNPYLVKNWNIYDFININIG